VNKGYREFGFFQCCGSGSGIRCLFEPWIRDTEWVKNQDPDPESGMNIPDYISESVETIFGLKILKFFDADPNPGSGIVLNLDPGWKNSDPIPDPQHWFFLSLNFPEHTGGRAVGAAD
jgi:hypothetical protein